MSKHFVNSFACTSQLAPWNALWLFTGCTAGASAAGAGALLLPPKSMDERPWPIVEPTATEPAVAAIWASMPGPAEAAGAAGAEVCAGGAGAAGAWGWAWEG